jgi:hypothetical protein
MLSAKPVRNDGGEALAGPALGKDVNERQRKRSRYLPRLILQRWSRPRRRLQRVLEFFTEQINNNETPKAYRSRAEGTYRRWYILFLFGFPVPL